MQHVLGGYDKVRQGKERVPRTMGDTGNVCLFIGFIEHPYFFFFFFWFPILRSRLTSSVKMEASVTPEDTGTGTDHGRAVARGAEREAPDSRWPRYLCLLFSQEG